MITSKKMNSFNQKRFMGKSEDVKPMDVGANSLFLELDTGKEYYFDGILWREKGSGEPVSPQGNISITANGEYNVTQYQTANVNVPLNAQGNIEITENGENINVAPYATATVNVSGGGGDLPFCTATLTTGSETSLLVRNSDYLTNEITIEADSTAVAIGDYRYDFASQRYYIYFPGEPENLTDNVSDMVNCELFTGNFNIKHLAVIDETKPSSVTMNASCLEVQ